VAVHVGSPLYPVTVKVAGVASEADADAGDTLAPGQERLTVTDAVLLSEKSFFTSNRALRRVLVIVHSPALSDAAHVPLESYPGGIGLSVAVQVGFPT
jgi:hypothetical protein